jgi:hypothetical protein
MHALVLQVLGAHRHVKAIPDFADYEDHVEFIYHDNHVCIASLSRTK